jgi:hypothetical protein
VQQPAASGGQENVTGTWKNFFLIFYSTDLKFFLIYAIYNLIQVKLVRRTMVMAKELELALLKGTRPLEVTPQRWWCIRPVEETMLDFIQFLVRGL